MSEKGQNTRRKHMPMQRKTSGNCPSFSTYFETTHATINMYLHAFLRKCGTKHRDGKQLAQFKARLNDCLVTESPICATAYLRNCCGLGEWHMPDVQRRDNMLSSVQKLPWWSVPIYGIAATRQLPLFFEQAFAERHASGGPAGGQNRASSSLWFWLVMRNPPPAECGHPGPFRPVPFDRRR